MEFDSFRVIIELIDSDKEKNFLYNTIYVYYPDAILGIEEKEKNKLKIELIIKNDDLGLFVIKKLIDRFHPWIKIYGEKLLIKPDFPEEFWKPIEEGGIGEKWTPKTRKRIKNLKW